MVLLPAWAKCDVLESSDTLHTLSLFSTFFIEYANPNLTKITIKFSVVSTILLLMLLNCLCCASFDQSKNYYHTWCLSILPLFWNYFFLHSTKIKIKEEQQEFIDDWRGKNSWVIIDLLMTHISPFGFYYET